MTVKQYDLIEFSAGDAPLAAEFFLGDERICPECFLKGEGEYAVRFMPHRPGEWRYRIGEREGSFVCVPDESVHGRVQAKGTHFCYEDGTPFYPFGTTCYAWTSQEDELIEETLATLKTAPFNKLRMCIFPKSMPYNQNEPPYFPFEKDETGEWDMQRPDFRYWDRLDRCLSALRGMNIEADIILFHPYDRWGFSALGMEKNLQYLRYAVARLSAYRNVWWSLANEYEMVSAISMEGWDTIGRFIAKKDAFHHLIGIHDWVNPFPRKDWLTHASIQSGEVRLVAAWKREYGIPVVIDEFGYEGDIPFSWGNLSAFEFMDRAWSIAAVGGYVTHGETFHREDEVLWWAKGGKLYGKAPERFAFLKSVIRETGALEPLKGQAIDPNGTGFMALLAKIAEGFSDRSKLMLEMSSAEFFGHNEGHRVYYFGRQCMRFFEAELPEEGEYRVEVIDIREMTRRTAYEAARGKVRIELPAKEGMALLITRLKGEAL